MHINWVLIIFDKPRKPKYLGTDMAKGDVPIDQRGDSCMKTEAISPKPLALKSPMIILREYFCSYVVICSTNKVLLVNGFSKIVYRK